MQDGEWRWRSQVGDTDDEEKVCRPRVEFVALTATCGDFREEVGCLYIIRRAAELVRYLLSSVGISLTL